jgi:hypothetical protein
MAAVMANRSSEFAVVGRVFFLVFGIGIRIVLTVLFCSFATSFCSHDSVETSSLGS